MTHLCIDYIGKSDQKKDKFFNNFNEIYKEFKNHKIANYQSISNRKAHRLRSIDIKRRNLVQIKLPQFIFNSLNIKKQNKNNNWIQGKVIEFDKKSGQCNV